VCGARNAGSQNGWKSSLGGVGLAIVLHRKLDGAVTVNLNLNISDLEINLYDPPAPGGVLPIYNGPYGEAPTKRAKGLPCSGFMMGISQAELYEQATLFPGSLIFPPLFSHSRRWPGFCGLMVPRLMGFPCASKCLERDMQVKHSLNICI